MSGDLGTSTADVLNASRIVIHDLTRALEAERQRADKAEEQLAFKKAAEYVRRRHGTPSPSRWLVREDPEESNRWMLIRPDGAVLTAGSGLDLSTIFEVCRALNEVEADK